MANRNGFIPSRQLSNDYVRNLPASAGGGQTIAKGDATCSVNGIIVRATAGQDPNQIGFGVVIATYTTANRPSTFSTVKLINSAQPGRVDVCFDPNQTYYVQCVTSCGPSNIGFNCVIDQSAANASLGISGQSVDIPASASLKDLFKIINIGPFDELAGKGTGGGANNGVEVRWNNHFLNAPTVGQ